MGERVSYCAATISRWWALHDVADQAGEEGRATSIRYAIWAVTGRLRHHLEVDAAEAERQGLTDTAAELRTLAEALP